MRRQGFEVFACTDHASFPRTRKEEKPRENDCGIVTGRQISPTRLGEEPKDKCRFRVAGSFVHIWRANAERLPDAIAAPRIVLAQTIYREAARKQTQTIRPLKEFTQR
jgi:hypothetical protein